MGTEAHKTLKAKSREIEIKPYMHNPGSRELECITYMHIISKLDNSIKYKSLILVTSELGLDSVASLFLFMLISLVTMAN